MLLTAQHQDDQAETVLLQLLRGAGLHGLAAMPPLREWRGGWQARPLLEHTRKALAAYAADHGLQWMEDPSNADPRFDRNYLRQQVMPLLRARWPGMAKTLSRSSAHLANSADLLDAYLQADLDACSDSHGQLQVSSLLELVPVRRLAVLRHWLKAQGAPMPDTRRLQEVDRCVLQAGEDANPQVCWGGLALRRYRDLLALGAEHLPEPPGAQVIAWPDQLRLDLPPGCGVLQRSPAEHGIPDRLWREGRISVRWRAQDTACRPSGRSGTRSFKKLCQELGVPPWQRDYLPLVFADEQLIGVADLCLCGELPVTPGEPCSTLSWHPAHA